MKLIVCLVIVVLALIHAKTTLADQPVTYPKLLSDWVASVPPKDASPEAGQVNGSFANWGVSMQQGRPTASLLVVRTGPDEIRTFSTHALPFQIKPSHDFSGFQLAARVDDGWIVGSNRGEWGGGLWWFSPDGERHYKISDDEVDQLLTTDTGVFSIKSLVTLINLKHPNPRSGEVLRLSKSVQGTWQVVHYAYLADPPEIAMQDPDGSLIIVTFHELLRVDRGKNIEALLTDGFWGHLQLGIHSIIGDTSGNYFVGMRGGVARIRHLGNRYHADWLQPTKTFAHDNPALYEAPL